MVDYKYKNLFWQSHVDKQLKIETDNGLFVAKNNDIHFEDFELKEILCDSEELIFGQCKHSEIKFQIRNAFIPLIGKWITITETLNGNTDTPFRYGRYKVFSDKPTADREYRDIVAYDAMYDILNADVSEWYNTILPDKESKVTLKKFRESFIQYFGISEQVPEGGLANDNMTVEKTIEPSEISGKDVINAICEINGCFGHIGRNGKFHYIYLPQDIQGLYPADFLYPDHVPEQWNYISQAETKHLYPQNPKSTKIGNNAYIKCQYEDYHVRQINRVQIRNEENDIGGSYPEENPEKENLYIVQDNFLVYGKSTEELKTIAKKLYSKITGVVYRPFSMECVGNPCFEVGDPIRANTKYAIVESYILSRTLKGIQGKRDTYSAKGQERREKSVNSVQKSIIQIKGKTNTLTRTVEENRLEVKDIEKNLQSEILQNASEIALRVRKDNVIASINLSPETITLEAQRIDLKGLVNAEELVSKFATISTLNATTASLQNLISQKATITDLNATNLKVQNLEIEKLSVNEFNAEKAVLESLIAKKIDATTVKADYMEVKNWTSAGYINANKINVNEIASRFSSSNNISVGGLNAQSVVTVSLSVSSGASILGRSVSWKTVTIEGSTITYLG